MKTKIEKGFGQAFEMFDERSMLEGLHKKVKPKTYYNKHKSWKAFLEVLSYVFNLVSVGTTGLAAYLLIEGMGGSKWFAVAVALALVLSLEVLKRKSSSEFWQIRLFRRRWAKGWLFLSLSIATISLLSSAYGTKNGSTEFASDPELIAKSETLQSYYATVEQLDKEIEDLRNNKDSKGVTFYNLNSAITKKTESVEEYRAEIMRLEKELEGKNEQLSGEYQNKVETNGWVLVAVVVVCEIAFEICIAYIWYFYFRSYVEKLLEEGKISDVTDFYQLVENQEQYELESLQKKASALPSMIPDGLNAPPQQKVLPSSSQSSQHLPNANDELHNRIAELEAMIQRQVSVQDELTSVQRNDNPVQNHTELKHSDLYTIEHTYTQNGKTVTVHYNMGIVRSRINQYDKELTAAKEKGSSDVVIQNLTDKLNYWFDKKDELEVKLLLAQQQ
ncbi:MAG: hypothetical protein AAGG68_14760 [Bacteroidota bacterium]